MCSAASMYRDRPISPIKVAIKSETFFDIHAVLFENDGKDLIAFLYFVLIRLSFFDYVDIRRVDQYIYLFFHVEL